MYCTPYNVPLLYWVLGQVIATVEEQDDIVRVVGMATKASTIKRRMLKLLLHIEIEGPISCEGGQCFLSDIIFT